jgi:hypothetical protein
MMKRGTLTRKPFPKVGYDLVYVEWVDSRQAHGWHGVDEIVKGTMDVKSVGWKIFESEDSINISAHYGPPPQEQFCGDMMIPKCSIKRILVLLAE